MEPWLYRFLKRLFHYSKSRVRMEAAFEEKHNYIPTHLYKYREFTDNHLKALNRGSLWMSAPENFNDPYDAAVTFDPNRFFVEDEEITSIEELENRIQKIRTSMTVSHQKAEPFTKSIMQKDFITKMFRVVFKEISFSQSQKLIDAFEDINSQANEKLIRDTSNFFRKGVSVLSLSANNASPLMWAHYSDRNSGFCIEYNFTYIHPDDLRKRLCFPVLYTSKQRDFTRHMRKVSLADFNNLFATFLSMIKGAVWSYEREWRLIFPSGPQFANRELRMPKPSTIILGAMVSEADEEMMLSLCKTNSIALKKMYLDSKKFLLLPKSVWEPK